MFDNQGKDMKYQYLKEFRFSLVFKAAFLFALILSTQAFANNTNTNSKTERKLYVGTNSTEAILSFKSSVELISASSPDKDMAMEQVEQEVLHLFGPMSFAEYKAVPKGNHKIKILGVNKKDTNIYRINYAYAGTIVLENGPITTYNFILPVNPDTIYQAGMTRSKNLCTDPHYQSEDDFWYFWNPDNYGCKLKKDIDYIEITGNIKRITNTTQTFPEYNRLVNENNEVVVTLLMGMDDPSNGKDPNKSTDLNAENFREIKESLIKRGYKNRLWTKEESAEIVTEATNSKFYIEEFSKEFVNSKTGQVYKIKFNIFFGPTGIDEDNVPFHYFFKNALENSSVMMYDGHSGLGGHLDLESIESDRDYRIKPDKNKYQIYFFNSCSSYTYYNTMYFARKKTREDRNGTKNLDILTNGLSTYFNVMHDTNMALLVAIEKWLSGDATISYQTLAKSIDSDNLFGINGDEDNPTSALEVK